MAGAGHGMGIGIMAVLKPGPFLLQATKAIGHEQVAPGASHIVAPQLIEDDQDRQVAIMASAILWTDELVQKVTKLWKNRTAGEITENGVATASGADGSSCLLFSGGLPGDAARWATVIFSRGRSKRRAISAAENSEIVIMWLARFADQRTSFLIRNASTG